jgi:tryptophan 2-monooxygenase
MHPVQPINPSHTASSAHATGSAATASAASGQAVVSHNARRQLAEVANRGNGRPMPRLNTSVGKWPAERENLPSSLVNNLEMLANVPKGDNRLTFQQEVHEHWKCLSDAEKVQVLELAGQKAISGDISPRPRVHEVSDFHLNQSLARMPKEARSQFMANMGEEERAALVALRMKGPAVSWLRSTLGTMNSNRTLPSLMSHLSEDAQDSLTQVLHSKPYRNTVDVDCDYKHFLKFNINPITLPPEAHGKEIAIVGSGAAGAVAARLLLQAGAKPVIFEQESKRGGRLESLHYHDADGSEAPLFTEMGAMRFPPTGRTWFYFLKKFGTRIDPNFPNPGKVPTALHFMNQVIEWRAGTDAPNHPVLQQVRKDWLQFYDRMIGPMDEARKTHDKDKMTELLQGYMDKYGDHTFHSGLMAVLQEMGLKRWTPLESKAFGSLGVGTGGFGPLYPIGFVEFLRIVLNKLEDNQHLLPDGATAALEQFYTTDVPLLDGTSAPLEDKAEINLNTKVVGVTIAGGKPTIEFRNENGDVDKREFAAALVATSPPAMERMGLSLTTGAEPVLSTDAASAITDLHMMSSTKVAIRTATKFWLNGDGTPREEQKPDGTWAPIPQCILSDQSLHGLWLLDYPGTSEGVALISYTWGDKSDKLLAMTPEERLAEFIKTIAEISPELARNLVPLNGEIHSKDWMATDGQHGAFKLNLPYQEVSQQAAFYQFQEKGKVKIANDGISHMGGWVEGAMQTGINGACAIALELGGTVAEDSPMDLDRDRFDYGNRPAIEEAAEPESDR